MIKILKYHSICVCLDKKGDGGMPFVGASGFESDSLYNRFTNLDNVEWHIIDYLIKDTSKYAEYMWKILKYDSMDCLSQPALTQEEKLALVYKDSRRKPKTLVEG